MIKRVFQTFDKNGDGKLDDEERAALMQVSARHGAVTTADGKFNSPGKYLKIISTFLVSDSPECLLILYKINRSYKSILDW